MKASLINSKVLILCVSAVVLAGSGCERRGRAPLKATTAAPGINADAASPMSPLTSPKGNVDPSPSVDIAQTEDQLKIDAQMQCDVAEIDVLATPRIEPLTPGGDSFTSDLDLVNSFQTCMKTNGLVLLLSDPEKTRTWSLDKSPALQEFTRLANLGGADDASAMKIMQSRVKLSINRLGKMITKYGSEKLKSTDKLMYGQKEISVGGTLSDIQAGIDALNAGAVEIAKMKVNAVNAMMTNGLLRRVNQSRQ